MADDASLRARAFRQLARKLGKSLRERDSAAVTQQTETIALTDDVDDEPVDGIEPLSSEELAKILGVTPTDAASLNGDAPLEASRQLHKPEHRAGPSAAGSNLKRRPDPADDARARAPDSKRAMYGRWLLEDRYSLDQVPCMLVEGDTRTYHFKGADQHVWVASSGKMDEGKRFCTLQLVARMTAGDPNEMYNGQPFPEICFRGQGKRISQMEKDSWNKYVHVRFQPKAWYDEMTCLLHAAERMPSITANARRAGRESVVILDNLFGQTTKEYRRILWARSRCAVHLLPSGVTDMLQFIDAGFGYLVKYWMGEFHTEWMVEGENLNKWQEGMEMWERRVHMTNMLHLAYVKACATFDFDKVALKLGMQLTIDGSGDDQLAIQGIEDYSFADADGGPVNDGSGMDESSDESDIDVDEILEAKATEKAGAKSKKKSKAKSKAVATVEEEGLTDCEIESSDDEEDDTAEFNEAADAVFGLEAKAPDGFVIVDTPMSMETTKQANELIGKDVLFLWNGAPVKDPNKFGWYRGRVTKRCTAADEAKGFNFLVKFVNDETSHVIPACEGGRFTGRKAAAEYPLGLTPVTWGPTKKWVVLSPDGATAAPKKKKRRA